LAYGSPLQVAADPLLLGLFKDVLDEAGHEFYMKPPNAFGIQHGQQITWAQVSEKGMIVSKKSMMNWRSKRAAPR
jgi:hypothetical protein